MAVCVFFTLFVSLVLLEMCFDIDSMCNGASVCVFFYCSQSIDYVPHSFANYQMQVVRSSYERTVRPIILNMMHKLFLRERNIIHNMIYRHKCQVFISSSLLLFYCAHFHCDAER